MYDYHIHSSVSADGANTMAQMAQAGVRAGLKEIAITDHFDPDYCTDDWPTTLDWPVYYKELEETEKQFRGSLRIVRGLEIGIQHGKTLETCRRVANDYDYDFLIGSFHCSCGKEFSCGDYFANTPVEEGVRSYYQYAYDCFKEYDDFNVAGHLNVIDRYSDYIPKDNVYMDIVEEILKLLIEKGKGIEINTSSFRYGMKERTTPTLDMLRLYRELGGEIITVGSDAHCIEHVGYGIDWAYDTLRSLGFKYITTFSHREPIFNKL